jgi:hypothetical protein
VRFGVRASSGGVCTKVRSVLQVMDSLIFQCLTIFVPKFGLSMWLLKCTKHVGCNSDVVQWRMCVRTEGGWAKGSG